MLNFQFSFFLLLNTLVLFGFIAYFISYKNRVEHTKDGFLLANRKLNFWESSFSIASTWIWAPALFVSAQQAYMHGWIGLFWFTVPNVLCLLLFSFFAIKIKQLHPQGFTLSEFMSTRYSNRVQALYWLTLVGLTVCAFAVQLLAGGQFIQKITGMPFIYSTILLAFIPLIYSYIFGLKASVITDFIKMVLILVLGAILVPSVIYYAGGLSVVIDGLGGANKKYFDFFTNDSWLLFLSFGLPVSIGLISGPFGDQSFWQRAYATKNNVTQKSFITAAFIFAIVPLMMGLIGLTAAGADIKIDNKSMVNIETIFATIGIIGVITFFFMTISALTSILDSKMCAISSIAGHDIAHKLGLNSIFTAKMSILLLTSVSLILANIPGLQILHLFLFYGTLRASTLIPTVLTLLNKQLNEKSVFYGIILSIMIGLPVFAYGNFNKIPEIIVTGSLLTVLLPLFSIIISNIFIKNAKR